MDFDEVKTSDVLMFFDTNKNKLRGKEQTSTPVENNCWHVTAVITSSCMPRWRILEQGKHKTEL